MERASVLFSSIVDTWSCTLCLYTRIVGRISHGCQADQISLGQSVDSWGGSVFALVKEVVFCDSLTTGRALTELLAALLTGAPAAYVSILIDQALLFCWMTSLKSVDHLTEP